MRMPVTCGGGRFPRRFRRSRARWLLARRHAARNASPAGGGSGFTSGTGALAFRHEGDHHVPRVLAPLLDRKSTRLNSSHQIISYAVFCLKKKKQEHEMT